MAELINNAHREFETYLKKWAIKDNRYLPLIIDVGSGTSRVNDMIVSIDKQADYRYASAQFVWDCKNLDLFSDNVLDGIFSSHCLEDFPNIINVIENWWKKLKPQGLMLLLLPDMEKCDCQFCNGKSRYATIEDYEKHGVGNPSHRTNVGKKFMTSMLDDLKNKGKINYKIEQMDTIPHNVSCSIDFVIRKL